MAPPTRFNSVRTGGSRPVARKPTFRDDSNLVGFRYDKAVAAEPPVHITRSTTSASARSRPPPLQRSPSSSTTTTASSSCSCAASISAVSLAGTAATSINGAGGPVVVAPPRLSMPVIAPPTEQHPALRSPLPQLDEVWKRDSGHGSSLVTKTIPEEEVRFNVAEPNEDDDCFIERRPTSKDGSSGEASHIEHSPVSVTGSAISGNTKPRRHSLNGVRPVTARASVAASTAAAPSRYSAWGTRASTNGSPVLAAAAGASRASPSSVIAPLDLRISSFATSSSSSSSSYNHHPAAAITASDFLPAPISPPASPSRASSLRWLTTRRQSLRLSFWGGSRDDDDGPPAHPQQQHQQQRKPAPAPTAPRRWQSVSQLRGGSTAGNNARPATAHIAGKFASGIAGNTPAIAAGLAPGTATPAPASSAKLQPPVSPAQSSSRSTLAMSSPPEPARDSLAEFSPLGIAIPTDSLLDEDFISSLNFSKRGSLMFDPDSVAAMDRMSLTDDDRSATPTQRSSNAAVPRPVSSATSYAAADDDARVPPGTASPTPDVRVMAPDVEQESQKVRQLYASGEPPAPLLDTVRHSYCDRLEPTPEVLTEDDESVANGNTLAPAFSVPRSVSCSSQHNDRPDRKESTDPAGGFEDWDDLDGAMVDRYGFIGTPRTQSRVGTPTEMRSLHHSPRRRNVLTKRDPMGFTSNQNGMRLPSRKVSARSLNTQHSEVSIVSFRSSRSVIRQAGNLLPQNRNRRWMDEAGDMLTVSPNLQDSVEEARVEKISEALKRKEIDRSEKWRRMARVNRNSSQGQGMEFEFDTKNPKLIERTWKGIPDRWRAAAWWSFLATSAKEHPGSATEDDITTAFRRLQDCASADDIQIDLDVPRTISRHIMFRRRYRGGQRLLFRVLHALSLYFPETGYVQGMASLAATLLCYFEEEKCFVMLVRMWQLRGLERLYQPGFDGLMAALREFETTWLHKDVARKMTDLCIDSTAYGTRWYLTLFNLSIPFAAQLRVWDVFLLLGDAAEGELPDDATQKQSDSPSMPPIKENSAAAPLTTVHTKSTTKAKTPSSGLDVLHATSAALIQALREVLLDSDFENAMKALTAWIPIKDEDLLMKVTRAEWKTQLKKRS
ncbi:uncharacterized protein LMH87_007885 [Akanthomyces muscarius]|uniref:Rab-GAP TBC domain-containing protein n=1 Tax=Akanthomyces muscarius TaxID=2231603 RepID=A0A9W8QK60_AKAMU|nr:uncharacterized protein LMH87_007885 [Akanthomyces muscarius]KAJ4159950.1 hypothetical protein LMH87_007885 [Akanthomyces muscarius]